MNRLLFLVCFVGGAYAWSACDGDDGDGPCVPAAVQVTPAAETIAPAATVQLNAVARDAQGNPCTGSTTWTTSNAAVATVSAAGLVTGVADGTAVITATIGGASGTADITVRSPVASVEVAPAVDTIRAGTTTQLAATPRDANGNPLTGRTINWSSSDNAVATVDANGLVTGTGNGTATITAEVEGQSNTADVTVWVGVTGSWAGTISAFGGTCGITLSLTEDATGAFTGDGQLSGPQCIVVDLTYAGMNNTDAVPDSVTFTWQAAGLPDVDFNGNFDGVSTLTGVINNGGFVDSPLTATRSSIIPTQPSFVSAAARGVGVADNRERLDTYVRRGGDGQR